MNATTQATGVWAEQAVDMPGMGPGANKAGWWVAYLNELMMLGKYDDVLKWLSTARQSGAIFAIIKAKEEMNQAYVSKKSEKKPVRKAPTSLPSTKKCKTKTEKSEPYFYTRERVA